MAPEPLTETLEAVPEVTAEVQFRVAGFNEEVAVKFRGAPLKMVVEPAVTIGVGFTVVMAVVDVTQPLVVTLAV